MSIPKGDKKIKIIVLLAIVVVLAFFMSFGGLKLHAQIAGKTPLKIVKSHEYEEILAQTAKVQGSMAGVAENAEKASGQAAQAEKVGAVTSVGQVIASKSGSKYHLPTCPGAKQIVEKNRVTFASAALAEKAGYTPASNCPGLAKPDK